MRILVCARVDLWSNRAGDTVHVAELAQALEERGARVEVCTAAIPPVGQHDIIHLFNLQRTPHLCQQLALVRGRGVPVVLTPFYWDLSEATAAGAVPARRARLWAGLARHRHWALRQADLLLVSGPAEGRALEAAWPELTGCWRTAVVGVSPRLYVCRPGQFFPPGEGEFVFCAARLTPTKNQLGLLRACLELSLDLVCAGGMQDPAYLRACMGTGGARFHYLGHLDLPALASAYRSACVHALASWYELPGLATLEAAALGTPVVSTDRGTARDYLDDGVWLCDPGDVLSIAAGIAAARAESRGRLVDRARAFTWQRAAGEVLAAYEWLLTRG